MEALIGFLKLEDPTSKLGGGLRGGSLRGSGNKSKNKNPLSDSGSRRKKSERSRQASSSWHSGGSDASAGLSNSFTSLKDSAGKLSKLLVSSNHTIMIIVNLFASHMNIICPADTCFPRSMVSKVDPKQHNADPVKVTKQALDFIFFPYVSIFILVISQLNSYSHIICRAGTFIHYLVPLSFFCSHII